MNRRDFGRYVIQQFVSVDIPGIRVLKLLRRMDMGYRTQDFYRDWREARGARKKGESLKYIRPSYRPGRQTIQKTDRRLVERFEYRVRVKVKKKGWDDAKSMEFPVHDSKLLTRQEIEDEAKKAMTRRKVKGYWDELSATPIEVWAREDVDLNKI